MQKRKIELDNFTYEIPKGKIIGVVIETKDKYILSLKAFNPSKIKRRVS